MAVPFLGTEGMAAATETTERRETSCIMSVCVRVLRNESRYLTWSRDSRT